MTRSQIAKNSAMTAELPALTGGPHAEVVEESNPFAVPPSRVGLYMTDDHEYYVNGEGPFVSVTTALKIIDAPELKQWLMNQTAHAAMLHLGELIGMSVEDGIKQIRDYRFPENVRDHAATLGTRVHTLSDMPPGASQIDSKGFEMPPEVFPYLEAYRGFTGWLDAHGGQIISSEKAVWNKTEGYAGTYDRLIRFDCECHAGLWCVDLKTGKHWYDWYGLQLAGYTHAEYIVLPNDPTLYPMPQVDRTAILHLRPDAYEDEPFTRAWRLVEYPTTGRDWIAFLAALELYRWRKEKRFKKSILNRTVQKPI